MNSNEETNEGHLFRNLNKLLMTKIILKNFIMTRKIQKHNFSH